MFQLSLVSILFFAQDPQSLEDRVRELEKKLAQQPPANPATAFNPAVTVFGNLLWRLDDKKVFLDNDPAEPRVDDTFNVREVEVHVRAAIDRHAEGALVLALESEVPGEFEAVVEEFIVTVKSLPFEFWEAPPLATKIRLGRMRVDFGLLNKLHLHDLPQSMYGLTIGDFLGEEGYVANGVTTSSVLGGLGESDTITLNLGVFQGGGIEVAADERVPALLANLGWFADLGDGHTLDLGLMGHYGGTEKQGHQRHATTFSVDVFYRWKPGWQGEWNSVVLGFQAFRSDRSFLVPEDLDADGTADLFNSGEARPVGFLLWSQVQFDRMWNAGVRFDRSDFIDDDDSDHGRITPYVTCFLSENFRVRASVERTSSDLELEDDLTTFLLEMKVNFGAHPPHPSWETGACSH